MPTYAKAAAPPSRTVIRRFSEAWAVVAPPVQDLDGGFQTMVVREASTSPAMFSRILRLAADVQLFSSRVCL
jgi:hypothetical protein